MLCCLHVRREKENYSLGFRGFKKKQGTFDVFKCWKQQVTYKKGT